MRFEISSYFDCDISKNPVGPPCIIFSHKSTKPGTCLGIISLPMRRVHDDDGSGSVEEESISDHPRSLDGGDGGRSALPEEMLRWAS